MLQIFFLIYIFLLSYFYSSSKYYLYSLRLKCLIILSDHFFLL